MGSWIVHGELCASTTVCFSCKLLKITAMLRRLKTVSMMLFLMGISTGAAFATSATGVDDVKVTQQSETATGVVKDEFGEVVGASVVVKGTTLGVVTDFEGKFSLEGVKRGDILQIAFVGYKTQEVKWEGTPLNILMVEDTEMLEEVVVVGFGTQKKVNLTGAVTAVGSKEIAARPVNSVTDALQGVVPGMNFTTTSGSLESTKSFNIRGQGSISSNSTVTPLVLIDGMEGDLNSLNPQDIDNISVLKDASASSIYGSRAAGGVVLVTTKSGKEGKTSVNYNNSFRFNSPLNMPEMVDSYTWAQVMNQASVNAGRGVWFPESKLQQIKAAQNDPTMPTMFANPLRNNQWEIWDDTEYLPIANTDWLKVHFGNSFSQEHTLSVNGGTDKIKYYLSANYMGLKGILKQADETKDRYGVNAKISVQLAKWIKMNYNMRFTRTDYASPMAWKKDYTGTFYHNMMRYWPIIPTTSPDGNYTTVSYIQRLREGGDYKTVDDIMAQQLSFQITPIEGLLINAELNYRINNYHKHEDLKTVYAYYADGKPFVDVNNVSSVYEYNSKSNFFAPSFFAEYSKSIADHNFKIMAGFQSEWYSDRSISASQQNIMAGLPTLDTTNTKPGVGGGYGKWTTAGFFGRLNYDYKGRYLVEANFRYDGSSRYLRDNRWNVFPSFSAGWNIAQEAFWEGLADKVNTLKLRGSWGELGNQNTNSWYPFYPELGYSTQGGSWLINNAQPNIASQPGLISALLTWERTQTWEVGLDWGAFNNRLTGSFGYFQRKTLDMVGPAQDLPAVLGTTPPQYNNLDMTSKGWDLQISWRDQINDFSYGATFILSDSKQVIDKYPNPSKALGKYFVGRELNVIYGYETLGIAQSQEEMDAHLAKVDQSSLGSNWGAGDIMYKDIDGDGKITQGSYVEGDSGDWQIIGNSTPRYNFGLNLDATWKGFDLKMFFQGTLKRDYYTYGNVFIGPSQDKWQAMVFKEHMDYWRPEGDPLGANLDAYYPKANWSGGNSWDGGKNFKYQTRFLQDASYVRLKNVTIGYTLPKEITRKFYVENLRVFASGENLLTFTNFTKLGDPELANGDFGKTVPLSQTFSVGLSVTF